MNCGDAKADTEGLVGEIFGEGVVRRCEVKTEWLLDCGGVITRIFITLSNVVLIGLLLALYIFNKLTSWSDSDSLQKRGGTLVIITLDKKPSYR